MRLIIDLVVWLTRHLAGVALIACALFGAHLVFFVFLPRWDQEYSRLADELQELKEDRDDLAGDLAQTNRQAAEARKQLDAIKSRWGPQIRQASEVVRRGRRGLTKLTNSKGLQQKERARLAARWRQDCNVCSWPVRAWTTVTFSNRCRQARQACQSAKEGYRRVQQALAVTGQQLSRARQGLSSAEKDLRRRLGGADHGVRGASDRLSKHQGRARTQQQRLHQLELQAARLETQMRVSAGGRMRYARAFLWAEFIEFLPKLALILLAIFGLPVLWKVLWFYVFMPRVITRSAPLRLRPAGCGEATISEARGSLELPLAPGQSLDVRAAWLVGVGDGAHGLRRGTELFWRLGSPFVSYAAGLFLLTRLTAEKPDGDPNDADTPARAVLAPQDDPDMYLCRLDLTDHPGFVIHPRHVVGIMGDVELTRQWRLFSWHALATRQVRFLMFSGTGTVILTGRGGISAMDADSTAMKLEEQAVAGFDGRLGYRAVRTETFLPYLLDRTPLVDDTFEGEGLFLREGVTGAGVGASPMERGVNSLLTALGKLLGF